MTAGTESTPRWPERIGFLPAFLTKPRKIGGRIDAWAAIGLLALGFVVFKLLPYFSPTAGADIAGNVAAIVPIVIAGVVTGCFAWVICKANFLVLSATDERDMLGKAADSDRDFNRYLLSTVIDRGTFLILWGTMFAAAVGK